MPAAATSPIRHAATSLTRALDGEAPWNHALERAAHDLRAAGLDALADEVGAAAYRVGGDDADVRAIEGRLWALVSAGEGDGAATAVVERKAA